MKQKKSTCPPQDCPDLRGNNRMRECDQHREEKDRIQRGIDHVTVRVGLRVVQVTLELRNRSSPDKVSGAVGVERKVVEAQDPENEK